MKLYRLIIFDADGTLTPMRGSAVGEFAFELLPGVSEKCAELRIVGAALAIASNQSRRRDLQAIDTQLIWTAFKLGIETCMVTYSRERDKQKPAPFMLDNLMFATGISKTDTLMVGDQDTDRQAAQAAGVDFMWATEFFGGGQ